ncbi:MAG: isopeptide-forming domain-containing fimbrial protein [Ruminococcaceae bacterium]|nr:isopeptide-forming domain-containing fimbrial protein [Oscillospiraceae bacterium]
MPTIENFATVRYTSGGVAASTVSNIAQIDLVSSVTFNKRTVGSTYSEGDTVTYIMTVSNTSSTPLNTVSITDNLGTFTSQMGELTPLTFVGPAILLVDGQDASANLTTDSTDPSQVVFTIPALAAGATANIIYTARVNEFAPLELDSAIVNEATLTSDSDCADGSASATVTVAPAADVSIFKQMSPNPVVCGDTVTYTIRLYNYGNIDAENVQLIDVFDPIPTNITVSRNGVLLEGTAYLYENGTLTVPATATDTIPAATFTRDATTGEVVVTPGTVEYVITGVI